MATSKRAEHTVATLPRVTGEDLVEQVRSKSDTLAVVDVRDSDYIGGHIAGGQNVTVDSLDYKLPELVRTLKDKDVVVFHCALSQQRGPSSALRYLRERDRLAEKGEVEARKDGGKLGEKQKVVVLEGGFVKWQEKYGNDKELTEDYRKELWEDGY